MGHWISKRISKTKNTTAFVAGGFSSFMYSSYLFRLMFCRLLLVFGEMWSNAQVHNYVGKEKPENF